MYLVLEGVDGAGKTTLAALLSNELSIPVLNLFTGHEEALGMRGHLGSPIPGIADYAEDLATADILKRLDASAIGDRGIASADVYRRFRNIEPIDPAVWDYYWRRIVPRETVVVHVKRDIDKCIAARADRFSDIQLAMIDLLFDAVVAMIPTRIPVIEVYNDGTPEETVREITDRLYAILGKDEGEQPTT